MPTIPAPEERSPGLRQRHSPDTREQQAGPGPGGDRLAQLTEVIDATIVNVALPHVQRALGFSGSDLEWVVNAYAIAFGGWLLLGGRAGDRPGRRRVSVAGLLLFSAASLLGGFAPLTQAAPVSAPAAAAWWHMAMRLS